MVVGLRGGIQVYGYVYESGEWEEFVNVKVNVNESWWKGTSERWNSARVGGIYFVNSCLRTNGRMPPWR